MRGPRPFRPSLPLPIPAELPAQHVAKGFRRHAIRIEEPLAIEMVGDWPGIGFHSGHPDRRHADERGCTSQQSEDTAAGSVHGPIGLKKRVSARGPPVVEVHENASQWRVSLTFWACGGLTPAILEKTFFSTRRPVPEAGGQRPTARCALGRKIVWLFVWRRCRGTKRDTG